MTGYEHLASYEISGHSLSAIVAAFRNYPSVASRYLEKFEVVKKLEDINREGWYPLGNSIAALDAMTNEVGSASMYKVGRNVPENVPLPPHIKDVPTILEGMDGAYRMNHRKNRVVMFDPATGTKLDGIGRYVCEVKDSNQIVMLCDQVPYPCDLDRGIIVGMASRFEPTAKIQHDNDAPCRKKGGDSCTYIVFW